MGMPLSSGRLEMLRESRLKKIRSAGPLVSGSLSKIMRKCGNPNCRCAEGERHPAYLLSWKESKMTKNIYVPVDMVKEVEKWVKEERRVRKLIQEITEIGHQLIKQHVAVKRAKVKNRLLRKT
jgi:intergrase/recombinase